MKKYLFLLAFIVSGFVGHAQFGKASVFPTILGDSLVNVDTVFKTIPVTAGYSTVGIQALVKKGTGTLTGKLYVWTSYDGLNYALTDSSTLVILPLPSAVSTLATYTYGAVVTKTAPAGVYYLVGVSSGTTLTSSPVQVMYTARKYTIPR